MTITSCRQAQFTQQWMWMVNSMSSSSRGMVRSTCETPGESFLVYTIRLLHQPIPFLSHPPTQHQLPHLLQILAKMPPSQWSLPWPPEIMKPHSFILLPVLLFPKHFITLSFIYYVLYLVVSHVRLCDLIDCCPPGSSVHGIFQARILEWVAISFSRGTSGPRDWTGVSSVSCTGRRILYHCATWETSFIILTVCCFSQAGFPDVSQVPATVPTVPKWCSADAADWLGALLTAWTSLLF